MRVRGPRRDALLPAKVTQEGQKAKMPDDTKARKRRQNPAITFSSFDEDDAYDEAQEAEGKAAAAAATKGATSGKGTLKKSQSLTIPTFSLQEEAKRPPL